MVPPPLTLENMDKKQKTKKKNKTKNNPRPKKTPQVSKPAFVQYT